VRPAPRTDDLDVIDKALAETGLDRQYHPLIRRAANRTGIGAPTKKGEAARRYVVLLMAYYLGKCATPIPPRELSTATLEPWAKRRVWDELEAHAHQLPAMLLDREPKAP
jgi:hypothetical protein